MTSVAKNAHINKLDDIVGEYNNTYHRAVKIKPVDVKDNTILILKKKLMTKILNVKLVTVKEFLNTKIFLTKDTHQTCLKKFLLLVKLKIKFHGHILLMISMMKKLLEHL